MKWHRLGSQLAAKARNVNGSPGGFRFVIKLPSPLPNEAWDGMHIRADFDGWKGIDRDPKSPEPRRFVGTKAQVKAWAESRR